MQLTQVEGAAFGEVPMGVGRDPDRDGGVTHQLRVRRLLAAQDHQREA